MSSSRDDELKSTLWKLSTGNNGDKYLTYSGAGTSSRSNQALIDDVNDENNESFPTTIRVYKLRWYILACICFANISNAINWINYSPIADFTGNFYSVGYDSVNMLSLVFLIVSIPSGFFSFWLIDNFGIRTSVNLGAWLNFLGAGIRVISSIDTANGKPLIEQSQKYLVLIIGQCVCALGQPFIMLVTTKFANTWFADDQRALANTIALSSNTIGILIGAFISPQIVNSSIEFISQMSFLNLISFGISVIPALMSCFILRSTPPTPPSYSSIINSREYQSNNLIRSNNEFEDQTENNSENTFVSNFKIYLSQIGKLLKSKDFLVLLISFGISLGIFNALSTLVEQVICIRGYTDQDAGYFSGAMIIAGIVGSIISGAILDKTKRFEEAAKICFCMCALANIFFVIIEMYNNDKSLYYYLTLLSFILIGLFGLPLLPICLEMSIECVYPIPEATSTGLLFLAGQFFGIIMIYLYPKASIQIDPNSYIYTSIQTCLSDNSNNSTLISTTTPKSSALAVLDFKYPLYGQTILLVIVAILFTIFFKCAYLRLRSEREKLAEKILNSARF